MKAKEKCNYNSEIKRLIRELENPLADKDEVMLKLQNLNLTEEERDKILNNLRKEGEIFEPRKNKLKTL